MLGPYETLFLNSSFLTCCSSLVLAFFVVLLPGFLIAGVVMCHPENYSKLQTLAIFIIAVVWGCWCFWF